MYEGYTTVKWNLALNETEGSPCEFCKKTYAEMAKFKNGIPLHSFLGFRRIIHKDILDEQGKPTIEFVSEVPVYKDAPIYNWTHVGCKCYLTVFKNGENPVIVTIQG